MDNCEGIQHQRQPGQSREDLLTTMETRKIKFYGHVTRSTGLDKTILQGTVQEKRKRKTETEYGGQHHRMDRKGVEQQPEDGRWQELFADTVMSLRSPKPRETQDVRRKNSKIVVFFIWHRL